MSKHRAHLSGSFSGSGQLNQALRPAENRPPSASGSYTYEYPPRELPPYDHHTTTLPEFGSRARPISSTGWDLQSSAIYIESRRNDALQTGLGGQGSSPSNYSTSPSVGSFSYHGTRCEAPEGLPRPINYTNASSCPDHEWTGLGPAAYSSHNGSMRTLTSQSRQTRPRRRPRQPFQINQIVTYIYDRDDDGNPARNRYIIADAYYREDEDLWYFSLNRPEGGPFGDVYAFEESELELWE